MISLNEAMARCLEVQIEGLKEQVKILRSIGNENNRPTEVPVVEKGLKRKKEKKEIDPLMPKKPLAAYTCFAQDILANIKNSHPEVPHKESMAFVGKEWAKLGETEKNGYVERARAEKERYLQKLNAYNSKHNHPVEHSPEHSDSEEAHVASQIESFVAASQETVATINDSSDSESDQEKEREKKRRKKERKEMRKLQREQEMKELAVKSAPPPSSTTTSTKKKKSA